MLVMDLAQDIVLPLTRNLPLGGIDVPIDPPPVCPTNYGQLGGPNTGYQGSPSQSDFEAYYADEGLAYLGISPSEPSTFYTGFIRVGPVNKAIGSSVTASLSWRSRPDYQFHAYKTFIFRIYGVKSARSPEVGLGNLPSAQVRTTAYVEINTASWTGSSNSTFWTIGTQVINVSAIVTEIAADPCFVQNNYIQFVFIPTSYPFGQGYITNGGQGLGREIIFNYS